MPTVRLSGTVQGPDDPARTARARLLYLLFAAGWDIYNSNGDQRITLSNIERKITESDAFVFTPGATIEDMFKAVSIFVGYQTLDRHLRGKPTVIHNEDGSWNAFFSLLDHLHRVGTISQTPGEFLVSVDSPEAVIEALNGIARHGVPDPGRHPMSQSGQPPEGNRPLPADYRGSVCVFCSATLEEPEFLADGEALGRALAAGKLGCITGAGRSGIMGAVVRGAVQAGGWAAGSNVPHIIEIEGLPDGLAAFWPRPDIYTRMEVMIESSNAFVILPGGAGTVQELFALMIFKHRKDPAMAGKPVIIWNRPGTGGGGFWDPLIALLDTLCEPGDVTVASTLREVTAALEDRIPAAHNA